MDNFPDELTLTMCMNIIAVNQNKLIKDIRQSFCEIVLSAVNDCEKNVVLEFPDKLWPEHRVTIAIELLERFGEIYITSKQGNVALSTKVVNDPKDIPKNIHQITLEFHK